MINRQVNECSSKLFTQPENAGYKPHSLSLSLWIKDKLILLSITGYHQCCHLIPITCVSHVACVFQIYACNYRAAYCSPFLLSYSNERAHNLRSTWIVRECSKFCPIALLSKTLFSALFFHSKPLTNANLPACFRAIPARYRPSRQEGGEGWG